MADSTSVTGNGPDQAEAQKTEKQRSTKSTGTTAKAGTSKTGAAKSTSKASTAKTAAKASDSAAKRSTKAKAPADEAATPEKAAPAKSLSAEKAAEKKSTSPKKAPARSKKSSTDNAAESSAAPAQKDDTSASRSNKKASTAKTTTDESTSAAPAKSSTRAKKSGTAKSAAQDMSAAESATPAAKQTDSANRAAASTSEESAAASEKTSSSKRPAKPQARSSAKKNLAEKADAPAKAKTGKSGETTTETSAKSSSRTAATESAATQISAEATATAPTHTASSTPAEADASATSAQTDAETGATEQSREKSGRSRSRGRGGRKQSSAAKTGQRAISEDVPSASGEAAGSQDAAAVEDTASDAALQNDLSESAENTTGENSGEKKRRSRGRRSRGRKKNRAGDGEIQNADADLQQSEQDEAEDFDAEAPEQESAAQDRESSKEKETPPAKTARRKMFVSVLPEELVEVVVTEEGNVQEYYVEMLHQAKTKGNIYKGIIHNVDPNLQAAFVSYGAVKNGFLQIDEVHPEYYVAPHDPAKNRKYPPIQKVLKAGQEVLVQVVKEPAGTKGAFLTTYLSMPGRFLVLTPGREQIGVSRKVESDSERARLREMLEGLTPGPGLGVIVRTVSMGASKTSLQRDLQQLKRVWKEVRTRGTTEKAPCLVYHEMDLTARAVRDYLTDAINEVWIDDEATAADVAEIASTLFPRKQNLVKVHKDNALTLFERFNIQRQLDQIQTREVTLPSGGRLVIDPTEALTAIDINSGRSGGKNNFEDMAFRTNMEAAKMIPLQLRLRDIGGQIVADFIEMRDKSHWREVEKTLRNGMKVDRARYDVGKISPFGLLEMVRQRIGSSAISVSTEPCPYCSGTGSRRNMEWQSQHALRDILRMIRAAQGQEDASITYEAETSLALHLLNAKRQRLLEMEQQSGVRIDISIKHTDYK